jgi:hypothetical protein
MDAKPNTVSELYPRLWLKPEDLRGRSITVTVVSVDVQEFRQRDGSHKAAAVLSFERASKRLIANKTQVQALATILGSERFAEWVGKSVALAPDVAPNGKPTIAVQPASG